MGGRGRGQGFKDIISTSIYRGCKPHQSLKRRMKVLPFISPHVPVGKSCMVESNLAENCKAKEEFGKAVRENMKNINVVW